MPIRNRETTTLPCSGFQERRYDGLAFVIVKNSDARPRLGVGEARLFFFRGARVPGNKLTGGADHAASFPIRCTNNSTVRDTTQEILSLGQAQVIVLM